MGKTLTLSTPRVADQYWAIQYFSCCLYVHSVSGIWCLVSGVWEVISIVLVEVF